MSARSLLMAVALLSGCASSTAAHPESTPDVRGCPKKAVFVPNMNSAYDDDEGLAYPVGDGCRPCSRALGFWYPSGTAYLVDPDGRIVELAAMGEANADPPFRVVGTLTVRQVPLPKRRKMLEALLRGGPPARADYEQRFAAMTKPKPPPKAPPSWEFVPDRDTPLALPRPKADQIMIAVRFEMHREHILIDAMVYVIDPTGRLVQFRLAERSESGVCNALERFAEIGVIAWEAVEPAERVLTLRKWLVDRPTREEYTAFVAELTNPTPSLIPPAPAHN